MNTPKKSKKKKSFGRRLMAALAWLLLIAVLCGGVVGFIAYRDIRGKGKTGEQIKLTVPEGASTASIASLLKENGLIRFDFLFRVYSKLKGQDGTYQQGDHLMDVGAGYDGLIETLQQTTYKEVETFTVTFPEGTTCLSMALKLEGMGKCTVDEFIDCCNHDVFDVPFFGEITEDPDKFIKLEGFLFPDTYEFPVEYTLHDIIQKMLETFGEKVYTEETRKKVAASGLTLEQNIILASITEKETLGEEMYAMVAGVFRNRLDHPDTFPCLESDTCAEKIPGNWIYGVLGYYFNGDAEGYVRNIPWSMLQAYDTYTHRGLPVGAICNPGLRAIGGALEPSDHGYYFFITDKDNNYYWGVTVGDHENNIKKVREYNNSH